MAKFKIGDRVRSKTETLLMSSGDEFTICNVDGNVVWVSIDGEICDYPSSYFEPINLTIHAGHYYRTRDGRKVGPMGEWAYNDEGLWHSPVAPWPLNGGLWSADGTAKWPNTEDSPHLIAEWVDEPAVEEAKLKVGDRVKFVDDYGSSSAGKEATVVKLNVWGEGKGVQVNQGGMYGVSTEHAHSLRLVAPATSGKFKVGDKVIDTTARGTRRNGKATVTDVNGNKIAVRWADGSGGAFWDASDFILESQPAIVALIENGQPKPSTYPFVHPDREAATKEARRLAGQHKGKEFGVYELVDTAKETKVYEHEWQRLAVSGETYLARKKLQLTGITGIQASRIVQEFVAAA